MANLHEKGSRPSQVFLEPYNSQCNKYYGLHFQKRQKKFKIV